MYREIFLSQLCSFFSMFYLYDPFAGILHVDKASLKHNLHEYSAFLNLHTLLFSLTHSKLSATSICLELNDPLAGIVSG